MAMQITHVVLAEMAHDRFFSSLSKPEYIIGTVFPDIRYLGGIDRKTTHVYELTLADIQKEQNPFRAGMLVHSLVDLVREQFITEQGIYEITPASPFAVSGLKCREDEVFYGRLGDWSRIVGYFDRVVEDELDFGVSEGRVRLWHANLQRYFSQPPTVATWQERASDLAVQPEVYDGIIQYAVGLRENERITEIIESMYERMNDLLASWS